jgi:DNA modification methylase
MNNPTQVTPEVSDYQSFIASKLQLHIPVGFTPSDLSGYGLFDFQESIVSWAIQRGRAAVFADTGLGKTSVMLAWADQVCQHTQKPALILAPLCVAQQTVREANRMGIPDVRYARSRALVPGARIVVVNYEMLEHFDPAFFGGVVLDESSILKSMNGKTKQAIIESFAGTDYRLSCTATPSPNDFMELGNQAEFLGVMSSTEMLAQFFIHDGGDTSKWRLKGHGKTEFWKWMATWAVCIRNPADLGFDGSRYILPPLQTYQHTVDALFVPECQLFASVAQTLNDRRAAKRVSIDDRVEKAALLVNGNSEKWIVWCHLNDESAALTKAIPDAIEVTGSMPSAEKEKRIMAFINGDSRVIVSKSSIMGFGLNLQLCARMAFVGLDDSYEAYYQAVRRCYRFGQTRQVEVHVISSEGEGAILKNIERKEKQAQEMSGAMVEYMREFSEREVRGIHRETNDYLEGVATGPDWTLHLGDCVEVVSKLPSDSIDFTIYSPPFASLYTYSNSQRDMGNCRNHADFYQHFKFLVDEMFRVTKPGRLHSFHCMNLPSTITRDGVIGIIDFRGELIRIFVEAGWIFHSEVVIWKDPVTAMQRTKALGLLYKQLRKDSCMSRQGIPDYLVTMRKPGVNPDPVTKTHESFPVDLWQKYASPVWMDINPTRTLQYRMARDNDDERHICPLALDVIERAIELWSNHGDLVLSPFAGIGSEGFTALQMGRRFVGAELKRSYFDAACRNLANAKKEQGGLFSGMDDEMVESEDA